MSLALLKEFINNVIERAFTAQEAEASGLALLVMDSNMVAKNGSKLRKYVLYDASKFQAALQEFREEIESEDFTDSNKRRRAMNSQLDDSLRRAKCIVGYISVYHEPGRYYDAGIIDVSAAERGYGPLLYDIVMSREGGLTSDRREVSRAAEKVWKKYMNRGDVTHKKIDDEDNPKTPTPVDDGELQHSPKYTEDQNPLNYVYNASSTPNVDGMIENSKKLVSMLDDMGVNAVSVEQALAIVATNYFRERYKNS